jgi:hypothetical protein
VIAGSGCTWSASTAYSWIHTTSSGSGNGTVNYTIDANTSTSARTGTITVQGQTFTITQAGAPCTYSLSPTSASPGSGSGSGNFSVTAGSGCTWSASTAATWIHTSSSGSGNGTVNYTIDANTSASSRTDTITVQGQTFTITQAGANSTPSITSPLPGSTFASSSATFQWTSGIGVSEYFFYVGRSTGANDIYGQSQGLNLSVTVNGLPVNGSTLYVRLWWATTAAGWQFTDYTYTAYSGTGTLPILGTAKQNSNIVLSWPTNFTGYALMSSTNLGAAAVWKTNLPLPVVLNGTNVVTNSMSGQRKFYRLMHP